jgi:transposase
LTAESFIAQCSEELRVEEQEAVTRLRQIHPEVDLAYDLVQQFAQMLHTRTGERLDAWLAQVESSKLPELQSFAAGVEKDKDAVRAGLTWWINNGMVEGHVHVTKLNMSRVKFVFTPSPSPPAHL